MIQKTLSIQDRQYQPLSGQGWCDHSPGSAVDESEITVVFVTVQLLQQVSAIRLVLLSLRAVAYLPSSPTIDIASVERRVKEVKSYIFSITYCEKSVLSIKAHDKNGKMSRAEWDRSVNVWEGNVVGFEVCSAAGLQNVDGFPWRPHWHPFLQ